VQVKLFKDQESYIYQRVTYDLTLADKLQSLNCASSQSTVLELLTSHFAILVGPVSCLIAPS
jgi:hypothetical protein